ncbi:MAG: hypothetical protein V1747_07695 [Candidatus Omnitrophota bacterium]
MREIYYAIYKNADYKTMVMVSLAEAIISKRGRFNKDKFILSDEIGLNRFEKQILSKICLNNFCYFHISDYTKWIDYLIQECIKNKYFKKLLVLGPKPTKYFKTELKKNLKNFNEDIIAYIDSREINLLMKINKSISQIKLPEFRQLIKKKDIMAEMMAEVMDKGYWLEADKL